MSFSLNASPLSAYLSLAPREAAAANAAAAADPQSASLISYFRANAGRLGTPDALLGDRRALTLVLSAFGVADQINNTALLRKVLTENPNTPGATVLRLGNARLIALAQALGAKSPPPLSNPATVDAVVKAYAAARYESNVSGNNGDLRLALYFTRNAGSLKSLSQLQGDPDLLRVASAALGIDFNSFAALDFNRQTALLSARIKPANLSDPSWVRRTAEQFLLARQAASVAAGAAAAPQPGSLAALFGGGSAGPFGLGGGVATSNDAASAGNGVLAILGAAQGSNGGTQSAAASLLSLFA